MKIDINCDLGEGFGNYKMPFDHEIMNYVSSVNIACGFHAGDFMTMAQTVKWAVDKKLKIGAHPGFQDLQGFGRRRMHLSQDQVRNLMIYQIGALDGFVKLHSANLHHVKPHGALYNMAATDKDLAQTIVNAVYDYNKDLVLYGLSGSFLEGCAHEKGLQFSSEVFADRAYTKTGNLVSRNEQGALIHDPMECVKRMARLVEEGRVQAITGEWIKLNADTICVHGDNAQALSFVKTLNTQLERLGHEIK